MSLDRLLSKITLVGSFALSSLYSCGSNDAGTPCKSDVDCKGENRICEKGECVDYTPSGQNNTNNASPLCNNYVELVNYCCKKEGSKWGDDCEKSQSSIVQSCESFLKDPYAKKEIEWGVKKYNSEKCCYFEVSNNSKCHTPGSK